MLTSPFSIFQRASPKGRKHFVLGIVDQNIPVGEIKNLWPAVLAGAVPAHVPELPADLERHGRLAGARRHGEKDSLLALQHRLDDPVDGDFLIVALAFADSGVGGGQKPACGFLIFDLFAGPKALPQFGGFWESVELALRAGRKVELDDAMAVGRIREFEAEHCRVIFGLLQPVAWKFVGRLCFDHRQHEVPGIAQKIVGALCRAGGAL